VVTKTELYALDLSSFVAAIDNLDVQLRANQDKLDDIAHAKETIASGMQGQSAQAMISKLDTLAQQINAHIASIQQTQAALTTYRSNKQQLQRDVIDYVDETELDAFSVSNNWMVTPSNTFLATVSPAYFGVKFIDGSARQMILNMLVSAFERYDLQAAIDSGEYVEPYTTSQASQPSNPTGPSSGTTNFPTDRKQARQRRKTMTTGESGGYTSKGRAGYCNTPIRTSSTSTSARIRALPKPLTTKRRTGTMPSSETISTRISMRHCRPQTKQ